MPCACKKKKFHVSACGSYSRVTHHYKDPLGNRTSAKKLNWVKKLKPPQAKLRVHFPSQVHLSQNFQLSPPKRLLESVCQGILSCKGWRRSLSKENQWLFLASAARKILLRGSGCLEGKTHFLLFSSCWKPEFGKYMTLTNGSDGQILAAGAGKPWISHWKISDSPPAAGTQGAQLLWIKSRVSFQGYGHQHSKISFLFLLSGRNISVPVETLGVDVSRSLLIPNSKRPRKGTAVVGCRDGLGQSYWAALLGKAAVLN